MPDRISQHDALGIMNDLMAPGIDKLNIHADSPTFCRFFADAGAPVGYLATTNDFQNAMMNLSQEDDLTVDRVEHVLYGIIDPVDHARATALVPGFQQIASQIFARIKMRQMFNAYPVMRDYISADAHRSVAASTRVTQIGRQVPATVEQTMRHNINNLTNPASTREIITTAARNLGLGTDPGMVDYIFTQNQPNPLVENQFRRIYDENPRLRDHLDDVNRARIVRDTLARIGDPAAIDNLLAWINDVDSTRDQIGAAMTQLGMDGANPFLVNPIIGDHEHARLQVVHAGTLLAEAMNDPAAIDYVKATLGNAPDRNHINNVLIPAVLDPNADKDVLNAHGGPMQVLGLAPTYVDAFFGQNQHARLQANPNALFVAAINADPAAVKAALGTAPSMNSIDLAVANALDPTHDKPVLVADLALFGVAPAQADAIFGEHQFARLQGHANAQFVAAINADPVAVKAALGAMRDIAAINSAVDHDALNPANDKPDLIAYLAVLGVAAGQADAIFGENQFTRLQIAHAGTALAAAINTDAATIAAVKGVLGAAADMAHIDDPLVTNVTNQASNKADLALAALMLDDRHRNAIFGDNQFARLQVAHAGTKLLAAMNTDAATIAAVKGKLGDQDTVANINDVLIANVTNQATNKADLDLHLTALGLDPNVHRNAIFGENQFNRIVASLPDSSLKTILNANAATVKAGLGTLATTQAVDNLLADIKNNTNVNGVGAALRTLNIDHIPGVVDEIFLEAEHSRLVNRSDIASMPVLKTLLENNAVKRELMDRWLDGGAVQPTRDNIEALRNVLADPATTNADIPARIRANIAGLPVAETDALTDDQRNQLRGEACYQKLLALNESMVTLAPDLSAALEAVRNPLIAHWSNPANRPPADLNAMRDELASLGNDRTAVKVREVIKKHLVGPGVDVLDAALTTSISTDPIAARLCHDALKNKLAVDADAREAYCKDKLKEVDALGVLLNTKWSQIDFTNGGENPDPDFHASTIRAKIRAFLDKKPPMLHEDSALRTRLELLCDLTEALENKATANYNAHGLDPDAAKQFKKAHADEYQEWRNANHAAHEGYTELTTGVNQITKDAHFVGQRNIILSYKHMTQKYRDDAALHAVSAASDRSQQLLDIERSCNLMQDRLDLAEGALRADLSAATGQSAKDKLTEKLGTIRDCRQYMAETTLILHKAKTPRAEEIACFSFKSEVVKNTREAIQDAWTKLGGGGGARSAGSISSSNKLIETSSRFDEGSVRVTRDILTTKVANVDTNFDIQGVQGTIDGVYQLQIKCDDPENIKNMELKQVGKLGMITIENFYAGLPDKNSQMQLINIAPNLADFIVAYCARKDLPRPQLIGINLPEKSRWEQWKYDSAVDKLIDSPDMKTNVFRQATTFALSGEKVKELQKDTKTEPSHTTPRPGGGGG